MDPEAKHFWHALKAVEHDENSCARAVKYMDDKGNAHLRSLGIKAPEILRISVGRIWDTYRVSEIHGPIIKLAVDEMKAS